MRNLKINKRTAGNIPARLHKLKEQGDLQFLHDAAVIQFQAMDRQEFEKAISHMARTNSEERVAQIV